MAVKLCANCGGRGEVRIITAYALDSFETPTASGAKWVICQDCNGLGYIDL